MRDILKNLKVFDIELSKLRSANFHEDMIKDRERWLGKLSSCLRKDEEFACPLCKGTEKVPFLAYKDYPLFECRNCSLVSPNIDMVKLEEINYHESELVEEDIRREIISTFEYRKRTFGPERLAYFKEILPRFVPKEEYLLDIGCGPGYLLSFLKDEGISARGLEVNSLCVEHCKGLELDVSDTDLEQEPNNTYSLITMFDVLEHLPNPIGFLSTIRKKLKANGHLLAYTPNIHSLSTHLMGGEHNMIAVFNHLCFYDKNSLDFLAERSGFTVVNQDFYGLDVLDFLAMKQSTDGCEYHTRLKEMIAPVQAMVDAQKLSNSMRILFRKT